MGSGQHITLVVGLVLFIYCLVVLLTETVLSVPLHRTLITLSAREVLEVVQKRKFEPVDVVLLPPFVMDGDKNLSVVSVLRFMPWFRRMHIYDPEHEASRDAVNYWKTHQKAKLVFFHQDLLEYTLTSPFLEERFVILRPLFVFSNYSFMWQFFMDDSPVLRSCKMGAMPLTRTIFNECSYLSEDDKYAYAVQKGVADKRIRYSDNVDHFRPPCSSASVTSIQEIGAVYQPQTVRALLQFEEVQKDRTTRPIQIVLAVIAKPEDDLLYPLPVQHASHVQVWVHLTDLDNPDARLSFTCRMIVSRNVFIEIYMKSMDYNAEQIGAEVMKRLKALSHQEDFNVLNVYSYNAADEKVQTSFSKRLANEVSHKLARTYSAPFVAFSHNVPVPDEQEWQRLRYL